MSPVLTFVEGSEFRKETARILARRLVAEVGLDALLSGGDAVAADLLDALGQDLAGLAGQALRDAMAHAQDNGFAEVSQAEADATMQQAIARVIASVKDALVARLADMDAAVNAMIDGSSADAVQAALDTATVSEALLSPIASLMAQTGAGVIQAIEADVATEAVAQHVEAAQGEDQSPPIFEWQTREDDKVCGPDEIMEVSCSQRHGRQLTYDEWGAFGLPGDPDAPTICALFAGPGRSYCRCALIPAGSAASTPTPVKIADAAKAGRQRAMKEAA